jgi:hypothetical protein
MEKEVNKGGRPPIYKDAEELATKIDEYFKEGVKTKSVIVGKGDNKEVVEMEVPTITGLCLYCGFASRQSFYDYEKEDGFSYIIKKARLFIETHYEELLQVGNTTGAIFALKNMGWIDRVNNDLTTKGESIYTPLTPKEAAKLAKDFEDEY